jgi:hypothetical protein
MSHWISHIGPKTVPRGYEDRDWWNLSEPEFLAELMRENQAYEDHYPCDGDDSCHSWLDELMAMSARFEELYPGKAPWRTAHSQPEETK